MPESKLCKHCNTPKPLDEFKKDSRNKSGYSSLCKSCSNEKNKQYREAHKEELSLYNAEYRQTHKESLKESHSNYYLSHIDKIQKYLKENADKIRTNHRIYMAEKISIHKRCPKCRKHFRFNKYKGIAEPIFRCKFCGTVLRRSKTLSSNSRYGDHANGFRIKVATA